MEDYLRRKVARLEQANAKLTESFAAMEKECARLSLECDNALREKRRLGNENEELFTQVTMHQLAFHVDV